MNPFRNLFCILALASASILPAFSFEKINLSKEQVPKHEADFFIILTHADITGTTTNATAQTIQLFEVDEKKAVKFVKGVLKTGFAKTGTSGYNSVLVEIGDDGDTDRLGTSFQVNSYGTEIKQKIGTGVLYAYTSANTVDALVTPMALYSGAELDAGEIWLYFKVHDDR